MALAIATSIVASTALLIAYLLRYILRPSKNSLPLPPGPKGLPLLGNVNDLSKPGVLECHHWLTHKQLYGPISSLTVLGQHFIIINSASLALDLLRDRALIHSGRATSTFGGSMIGWNNVLPMQQPNETLKAYRKNIPSVASSAATLKVFDAVQDEESVRFLGKLLENPEGLFEHIKMEAGAVILRVTYGYTPNMSGQDPLVDMVEKTMSDFTNIMITGNYFVDFIPASIVGIGLDPKMQHIHKWSAASMYIAGADTTAASLSTFFLAMALNPQIQARARAELDALTNRTRLPHSADRNNLPYMTAILLETHRWHPVAPKSLPHAATRDDEVSIEGRRVRIPKGAVTMGNTWWFTHDPSIYQNPMTFDPSRHLVPNPPLDPRIYTFGYGRRVCPGRYVADHALFITMAQVLSVFEIKSVEGQEPEVRFEPGVVSRPVEFRCTVSPRDGRAEELVRESGEMFPLGGSDAGELELDAVDGRMEMEMGTI